MSDLHDRAVNCGHARRKAFFAIKSERVSLDKMPRELSSYDNLVASLGLVDEEYEKEREGLRRAIAYEQVANRGRTILVGVVGIIAVGSLLAASAIGATGTTRRSASTATASALP